MRDGVSPSADGESENVVRGGGDPVGRIIGVEHGGAHVDENVDRLDVARIDVTYIDIVRIDVNSLETAFDDGISLSR